MYAHTRLAAPDIFQSFRF